MKHTIARILISDSASAGVLIATNAAAIDWNITGFVRQEIAYSLSGSENDNNHNGNPWNNKINPHITHAGFGTNAGTAFTNFSSPFANSNAPTALYIDPDGNAFGGVGGMFASGFAATAMPGFTPGTLVGLPAGTNTANAVDCHFNYQRAGRRCSRRCWGVRSARVVRWTGDFRIEWLRGLPCRPWRVCTRQRVLHRQRQIARQAQPQFQSVQFARRGRRAGEHHQRIFGHMKIRGYFDGTRNFTDAKTGDHFGNPMWGNRRGTITEWNSPDSIIDIPALYLDWNRGPL